MAALAYIAMHGLTCDDARAHFGASARSSVLVRLLYAEASACLPSPRALAPEPA